MLLIGNIIFVFLAGFFIRGFKSNEKYHVVLWTMVGLFHAIIIYGKARG